MRQVAADVQHVPAAHRVPGDHRHDRLGQPADLDLQVQHVEPADALVGDLVVADVAVVAADALVAAGAERPVALAGQDDDADPVVVAGEVEGRLELEQGLRPERVAHLGTVDRDLGHAVAGELVLDVGPVAHGLPVGARADRRDRRVRVGRAGLRDDRDRGVAATGVHGPQGRAPVGPRLRTAVPRTRRPADTSGAVDQNAAMDVRPRSASSSAVVVDQLTVVRGRHHRAQGRALRARARHPHGPARAVRARARPR